MFKHLLKSTAIAGVLVAMTSNAGAQKSDLIRDLSQLNDCKVAPMQIVNSLKSSADSHNASAIGGRSVEEGFEGTFLPECWTSIDADGDGQNWFAYNAANSAYEGTFSAASASWTGGTGPLTPDNWLISPQLTVGPDEVLQFQIGAQDPAWPAEEYSVYVSTTGNAVANFTTQITNETLTDGTWQAREFSMAAYAGQNIYIAFRHNGSTDQFYIKLDGVVLPGQLVGCADCSGVEYPEIVAEEITCTPNGDGWLYNLEVASSAGGAFTLSNSANGTTYPITGATNIQAGPFDNDQTVTFTITYNAEPSCFISGVLTGNCTEPCAVSVLGPWTDLSTAGIPVPDGSGNCTPVTITDFEIWAGEAYALNEMPAGVVYEFNACEGPNAFTWPITFTVVDPSENIIAYGTNGDNCSITWETTTAGDYLLIITRVGYCGSGFQIENGYPSLTCLGFVGTNDLESVNVNLYPNPATDQLNVVTALSGNAQVRVFDAVGRLVGSSNEVLNGSNFVQNISNLDGGLYTIQIQTATSIATKRFVKE
jgi:hypothetical protein